MSTNPNSSDFHYKEYSLQQLDNWVHDALNCDDLTPQEIYDTVIRCVDESVEHHKKYLDKSTKLLSLLKGHVEIEIDLSGHPSNHIENANDTDWEEFWGEVDSISENYSADQLSKSWEEYYYPEEVKKSWILPVEEAKDADTDKTEYLVTFPDDLLEAADLKEGDTVEWVDRGDGSYQIKKVVKEEEHSKYYYDTGRNKTYDEMINDGWSMTDDGFWIKEK